MRKSLLGVGALFLVAVSFAAGTRWSQRPGAAAAPAQSILYYACPMHPQYRSDHPGDCVTCGMRLEPVRGGGAGAPQAGPGDVRPRRPGTTQVSVEQQQAVGVRVGVAERVAGRRTLRTTGRVAPDENATYPLVAGTSGWIRTVGAATTGSQVRRNERLASFYSPDFLTVQQSYFSGLETLDRVGNREILGSTTGNVAQGVQRFADTMLNMGLSDAQLEEMRKERRLVQDIYLVSPVDGFVLQRRVSTGLRFDRGYEFYRIADLRKVWILADIYQHQRPFVRPGMVAQVAASEPGGTISATVSRAEPVFDETTLTLKVRLEAPNPGALLKPGMFVDVELPVELPPTLAVPADAIVDFGTRKTVYVDRGEGYFEPRQVETGWRIGDQVEIVRGLMAGERIVISGTFLIDSESRMKAAALGIYGAATKDPVCGMDVDEQRAAASGRRLERDGRAYFFCSDECRGRFEQDPARYLKDTGAPPVARPAPAASAPAGAPAATAKDPVCGMEVDVEAATAAGRKSVHGGRTYYFCADDCKKKFDARPAEYSGKS